MTADEVLVVDYTPETGASPWPVTSSVPPRVALLRAPADALPDIARLARLAMARTPTGEVQVIGDERVVDELDPAGRLFVDAWRRKPLEKRHRTGDGQSWDAAGFEPPDPPPGWVDPSRRSGEG